MNLLSQFADDMDMSLEADQINLETVFAKFDLLHRLTGLTTNYDKTKNYQIGSLKNSESKLITQKTVSWTNEPINVLGVWIDHENNIVQKLNYEPVLVKMKQILNNWHHRNLSLVGKINIVDTLVGSLFVYKMMVLENLDPLFIQKVNEEIQRFIWNGNKAKIPLKSL